MKLVKTVLMVVVIFLLGGTAVMHAQDKYGSEPDKCKTNLSLFHEAVKMKNYEAAYEPWKWCMDNCPEASKIIYSDGIKMTEAFYDENAGLMKVEKGQKVTTNDHIFKVDKQYFIHMIPFVYNPLQYKSLICEYRGGNDIMSLDSLLNPAEELMLFSFGDSKQFGPVSALT